ncbi:thioredoxin family protein [Patescibacteria group bacterium]|nr:thioredoxin family protein [Patescibacteria group bacterium]
MVLMESLNLPLMSDAPDFELEGIDGKTYSLADFEGAKVLVVVFMCNHCPYVQAVWDRLVDLQKKFKDKGVRFVGINPNFHPDYPQETMEKMKEYADRYKMNFPYLLDESQNIARAYRAQCTPDIFVYDQKKKLAYHGRIDDNWQDPGRVSGHDLAEAIVALFNAQSPSGQQYPCMGCSIKWRE